MRTSYVSNRQKLGQFFTPERITDFIISFLDADTTSILELGCGEGTFGKSALSRFPNMNYVGVELDRKWHKLAIGKIPEKSVLLGDALSMRTFRKLQHCAPFSAAIGNPPYTRHILNSNSLSQIYRAFPSIRTIPINKLSRLDLAFLAASLSLIQRGGVLAFILPKTFFSDPGFRMFRQDLVKRYQCDFVAELDSATFEGIEVDTTFLLLRNQAPTINNVRLGKVNLEGEVVADLSVSFSSAIDRMDFSHYKLLQELNLADESSMLRLADVVQDFQRGSLSKIEFVKMGREHFHTTDFPSDFDEIDFGDASEISGVHARAGDILVPRVGSRCLLRQAIVQRGGRSITDCIYRIRPNEGFAETILQSLQHEIGQRWRQAHARGTCAKYLTVTDIMQMPLIT
ncbi:N-6 DNA methylase [Undibacterium jejuense]|uniref:site-specific DNA-methyltransferase (adenine-specific) n=1 Tax=Undibacterium jejuense TaxID=1344949 RepID=A0A923HKC0_9BURK|nr:N-6 DNA methylase [Undibacterium jejuense]MBC3862429.1 N-6 DNA methylase [Undibacterium jejuense]